MRLSASRLSLLRHCQWFARDDVEHDPPTSSEKADTGKLVHRAVELRAAGWAGTAEELAGDPEYPLANVGWADKALSRWGEFWPVFSGRRRFVHEAAYILNVDTGEVRRESATWVKDGRKRGKRELPVLVDIHAADGSEAYDLKTGKRVDPPADNPQVLVAALALQAIHPQAEQRVGLLYLNTRGCSPDVATVTALDVLCYEDELRTLAGRIDTAKPQPGSGAQSHCHRCPAKRNCAAWHEENRAPFDWDAYTSIANQEDGR